MGEAGDAARIQRGRMRDRHQAKEMGRFLESVLNQDQDDVGGDQRAPQERPTWMRKSGPHRRRLNQYNGGLTQGRWDENWRRHGGGGRW